MDRQKLKSLSQPWEIIRYKEGLDTSKLACHAVEEYPTNNDPADYALFVKGRLLGILEAKKVRVGPQNVLNQGKRYAQGIVRGLGNWNGYRVVLAVADRVLKVLDAGKEELQLEEF